MKSKVIREPFNILMFAYLSFMIDTFMELDLRNWKLMSEYSKLNIQMLIQETGVNLCLWIYNKKEEMEELKHD